MSSKASSAMGTSPASAGKLSFPAMDAKSCRRAAESRVAGGDERSELAFDHRPAAD
jgi:hypothetical protein